MKKTASQQALRHLPEAERALRHVRLRVTQSRLAVLTTLLGAHAPLSHQALHAVLPHLDRVTLYRTLDSLITAGLAQKITDEERAFRYCATGTGQGADDATHDRHGHFTCSGCGKVFCLSQVPKKRSLLDKIHQALQHSVGAGFQTHSIELTVKGWCADCMREHR
jgi:Fur family ferric uptake transcriptional regulator